MIVMGYDLESTGLDVKTARILEVGAVIWDTEKQIPIDIFSCFVRDVEILPEYLPALAINGIDPKWLAGGISLKDIFRSLYIICRQHKVEAVVAHNGGNYDKPLTMNEMARLYLPEQESILEFPWIDSLTDLPFKREPKSRSLNHLAADHGFINPFQHRAVFDVLTMLKIMSHYDFQEVLQLSKIPFVTVRALVTYDERQLAKDMRFSWAELGDKKYPGFWVKRIRENQLEKEQKLAEEKGFKIIRIE